MSVYPTVPLADTAEIAAGITLGRKTKESDLVTVPYLRVANVQDGHLKLDDLKTIAATPGEIEKLTLRNGDLLLTEGGDLDKLGRGALWRDQVPLCIHQNHIFRVRLDTDRYDPDYVSFQIGSPYGKAYFLAHAKKTTGIASINQRVLGAFPLVSPPIDQQRKIAWRLSSILHEVQIARRAAKAQVDEANLLRLAVRGEAFAGLLDRFPRTATLSDMCMVSAGGTPSRGNASFFVGDIPWVKTLDLNFGLVVETEECISEDAFASIRGELLSPGTVLVAMYGGAGTIGKSGVLGVPACTNQAICALRAKPDSLDPTFLHEWLCYIRPEWMQHSGGNRKDPNINKSVVENMTLPTPPLNEQHTFVALLKSQLNEADLMVRAAAAQLAEIEQLPQRMLAHAFSH